VAGFTSGDGSFNIKTTKTRLGKVQLRYSVTLHIREKDVIIGLANYIKALKHEHINEDSVKYVHYTKTSVAIQIVNFSDIVNRIIPFFEKYSLRGNKLLDFYYFKKVVNIVGEINKYDEHSATLKEILKIKRNMNRYR